MQIHRRFLSQHRLQRYVLWLVALLSWIAAVAFADAPVGARQCKQRGISLWRLSRWVANLIATRALTMAGRPPRRRHEWRRTRFARPSHFRRSILGAKLRRALKHRDPATHIAQLITILRNLDAYAAHLARNMRRGLRRLVRTKPPIAPAAPLLGGPAPLVRRSLGGSPAFSDSSQLSARSP